MKKKKPSLLRSLGIGFGVIIGFIVFAYSFQVTNVNFATIRSEDRLTQLRRVLRALVKPDILEYQTVDTNIDVPIYLPCPSGQVVELPEPDKSKPYLILSTPCAAAKETITIEGYDFIPNSKGPINFVAASGVSLQLENFQSDENGYFKLEVEMPNRQPVAEAQYIRAITRVEVGSPMLTRTAIATWSKIVETVFIALLATTIGTAVSIPVSFVAARNLMSTSKSQLTSVAFSIIGLPLGMWFGIKLTSWISALLSTYLDGIVIPIVGVIILPILAFLIIRWGMPSENQKLPKTVEMIIRTVVIITTTAPGIGAFILLGALLRTFGSTLTGSLGVFSFLGNFIFQLGDTAGMLTPAITALISGAVIGSTLGKIGQTINNNMAAGFVKITNIILMALAGALLFAIIGAVINWFYQLNDLSKTLYWPAGIGATLGLLLALLAPPKQALPTGMVIYFITRTVLNATRSVEPLVMAIVFVIWVGIGPFAGSLALALHTIASLSKLYSEQVESILPGPLEAIQATGANRLQTIVYAVIPQIVPPYISFTMYRWDINVRMSTIIGFVGGGGIGFLLIQNINLLKYRAASVQMLAIAIVVAIMDYVSSQIRERIV
jgi:phosphonate ABC transporter permease subunit PhnE